MKKYLITAIAVLLSGTSLWAGNPERIGQAGATQLLVNSWGVSSGFNSLDIAYTSGLQSIMTNPAGMATTRRTELAFNHTRYLVGADISMNTFGVAQSLKSSGVLGIYFTSFDLGEFIRTTEDSPDGGLGTFSPTFINLGISYAKQFTDHIYVGATIKLVNESISDASATGVGFDAGVQYRTNIKKDSPYEDQLKLGISLRNVGTSMRYGGDGLAFRATRDEKDFDIKTARPTAQFEMPSTLNIGASYDFYLSEDHRVTALGGFIAHAYGNDQFGAGVEYGFKKYFRLRYSFLYEDGILDKEKRRTAWTGHGLGGSVQIPFKSGKEGGTSIFAIDYSYRSTNPFQGTHVIGIRLDL